MKDNFWKNLPPQFLAIAPMSNVTDEPFRQMLLQYGKPDVFWTEFVSVQALFSKGKKYCLETLRFSPEERPIVAQVFGNDPYYFKKTAQALLELGFDGVDINMGCPNNDIEKKGGGAAMMKDPALAKKIIREIKQELPGFPISVKTRIGYDKNEIEKWLPAIMEEGVSAITVHLRSRRELFHPPAHWELAPEILKLRDKYCPETIIIGNGDIRSYAQAKDVAKQSGFDGVMIGRGAIGNPWIFTGEIPTIKQRLDLILAHTRAYCEFYGINEKNLRNFESVKKHLHAYCKGFDGAKGLRDCLMKAKNEDEIKGAIGEFLKEYNLA